MEMNYYTNTGYQTDPNELKDNSMKTLPESHYEKLQNGNVNHVPYIKENGVNHHHVQAHKTEQMKFTSGEARTESQIQIDKHWEKPDDDVDYSDANFCTKAIKRGQLGVLGCCIQYSSWIKRIALLLLLVGYGVYFTFALIYSVQGATALIAITGTVMFFIVYAFIRDTFGDRIKSAIFEPCGQFLAKNWRWLRWVIYLLLLAGLVTFLALDAIKRVEQLIPLGGAILIISLEALFSKHPHKIKVRSVVWGFGLQVVLGIVILRWKPGYDAVEWVSDQVQEFMSYTLAAGDTVFGFTVLHPFIFIMMPMLIWFGAMMSVLYYLGITQMIILKMGWFMQATFGTTAVESLSVSSNIFLSGMDTLIMLKPYLQRLTKSEFHAMQVGNQATVAGFVFAVFIALGAPGQHLLTAAVMSAPAAMAIAKLNYPETEESITDGIVELASLGEKNLIEAASNGAKAAGKTVTAVVVSFIFMLSAIEFLNATLAWLGARVGHPDVTFQLICSYLFWPIAFLMGIPVNECNKVAELLGIKIFTSEFLAYSELGDMRERGDISERSAAITTYALCGFSGLATTAIAIGVWSALEPSRVSWVANQMVRVLINANMACLLTAMVASVLYKDELTLVNVNGTSTLPPTTEGQTGGIIDIILDLIVGIIPTDIVDSFTKLIIGFQDLLTPNAVNCTGGQASNEIDGDLQGILDVIGALLPGDVMSTINQIIEGVQGLVRPRSCELVNVTTTLNGTLTTAETITGGWLESLLQILVSLLPEDKVPALEKVVDGIRDLLTPVAVNCSDPGTINPTIDPDLVFIWDIIKDILPENIVEILIRIGDGLKELFPVQSCDVTAVAMTVVGGATNLAASSAQNVAALISQTNMQTLLGHIANLPQDTIQIITDELRKIVQYMTTHDLSNILVTHGGQTNPLFQKVIGQLDKLPEHVHESVHKILEGALELLTNNN